LLSAFTTLPIKEDFPEQISNFLIYLKVSCLHLILLMGMGLMFCCLIIDLVYSTSLLKLDVCRHVRPVVGRKINWMKAGITECDVALTVSPHYVKELTSGPDKGVELDAVLRAKPLEVGIVNGMDVYDWNPATDSYVSVKYNATTVRFRVFYHLSSHTDKSVLKQNLFQVAEARALNKEMLQAEVGLPVDSSIPVIIFIGRLEEQKGSDILIAAIPEFVEENVQIIVLVCLFEREF
jgi:granule-bound starch synthase